MRVPGSMALRWVTSAPPTVFLLSGCLTHEDFADTARARAANEFHCSPADIKLTSRPDLGFEVLDVAACGRRARYSCVNLPKSLRITCIREHDPE